MPRRKQTVAKDSLASGSAEKKKSKKSSKVKPKTSQAKATYHKSKNNRYYKKIQVDGKTRVRFVSNAEATGSMSKPPKPRSKPRARRSRATTTVESPEEDST